MLLDGWFPVENLVQSLEVTFAQNHIVSQQILGARISAPQGRFYRFKRGPRLASRQLLNIHFQPRCPFRWY